MSRDWVFSYKCFSFFFFFFFFVLCLDLFGLGDFRVFFGEFGDLVEGIEAV